MEKTISTVDTSAISSQRHDSQPVISMLNIVKMFKTSAGDVTVLKGISTDFYQGEFVGIVGKSGSGKSTLVNMITGIDHPTSGEVIIGDAHVHKFDESQMAKWRGLNLGIVFQFYQLLPMLTLLENTILPMEIANKYSAEERETRAMDLLKMVGLADDAHKLPAAVSGGQQQAAAIARALANDPPYLVADEPTGNLDTRTAERIIHIFESLVDQGKTIIMVTHDPGMMGRVTRTLLISDGEIINESIAKTFPYLNHTQMLKATHNIKSETYQPGDTIIRQGEPNSAFYLITHGSVSIEHSNGSIAEIERLGPGGFFGETELIRHPVALTSIKATDAPVQVLSMAREVFLDLVTASKPMQETIEQTIQQRLKAIHKRG